MSVRHGIQHDEPLAAWSAGSSCAGVAGLSCLSLAEPLPDILDCFSIVRRGSGLDGVWWRQRRWWTERGSERPDIDGLGGCVRVTSRTVRHCHPIVRSAMTPTFPVSPRRFIVSPRANMAHL